MNMHLAKSTELARNVFFLQIIFRCIFVILTSNATQPLCPIMRGSHWEAQPLTGAACGGICSPAGHRIGGPGLKTPAVCNVLSPDSFYTVDCEGGAGIIGQIQLLFQIDEKSGGDRRTQNDFQGQDGPRSKT